LPRIVAQRADILPILGEIFREHGYDGAALAEISARTGLGRSSLYHFFPGGKDEMAQAVLAEIDDWFERHVFRPLAGAAEAAQAIDAMFTAVESYFRSGRRVCLVGLLALSDSRDRFGAAIASYFRRWTDALTAALRRAGEAEAEAVAEDIMAAIQGGLVMARALNEPELFCRVIGRCRKIRKRE